MSEDDLLPETSYTAEGKERIQLWKQDMSDLAKDTGGPDLLNLRTHFATWVCMHLTRSIARALTSDCGGPPH